MTNSIDLPLGVGVIVIKDGKVLTGTRTDNGLICGPGSGRYPKGSGKSNGAPVDSNGNPYEFKTVRLSRGEYGKMMSEVDSNYDRYEGKDLCIHYSSDLKGRSKAYYFENHGYNEYNFYKVQKK